MYMKCSSCGCIGVRTRIKQAHFSPGVYDKRPCQVCGSRLESIHPREYNRLWMAGVEAMA
jgi:hypothetical protein